MTCRLQVVRFCLHAVGNKLFLTSTRRPDKAETVKTSLDERGLLSHDDIYINVHK